MKSIVNFFSEETGVGVVEIILILVVLIGLVIVFKTKLTSIMTTIFSSVTSNVNKVIK